jgi:hypothetical protein
MLRLLRQRKLLKKLKTKAGQESKVQRANGPLNLTGVYLANWGEIG